MLSNKQNSSSQDSQIFHQGLNQDLIDKENYWENIQVLTEEQQKELEKSEIIEVAKKISEDKQEYDYIQNQLNEQLSQFYSERKSNHKQSIKEPSDK